MFANKHYDDDALIKLLRNRMGEDQSDVKIHLESCETCQANLETLSQGGLTWDEVGKLLAPNDVTAEPLPSRFSADAAGDDSEVPTDSTSSFLQASEYPDSLGRFARYEIMAILGRGGMGLVIRGYDTSLNRHSAVKVLAPELASSAAARKRFSREARSAAAVVHSHVVPIQTVDEHNGLPCLVMPVVEGKSVDARIQDSGPLEVIAAVRIAAQIADGLAAAHEQGLVHRDIKPANVLLENGVERVQITDFGLARAIDDASMTRSGAIAGTPQYMSPEQAHGDAIDHRSDLFSLGSLIYFMLTGRSPFRAETTMGVVNRIGNDQPRAIRSINEYVLEWLERIVFKLLEKQPSDRFQSANEVAELLDRWLAHLQQPALLPPPQPLSSQASIGKSSRKKWLVAATGAGVLVVIAYLLMISAAAGPTPKVDGDAKRNKQANGKQAKGKQEDSGPALTGLAAGQKELWRANLGTITMRAPVVHGDHINVGSNNGNGYLNRFPASVDLGVQPLNISTCIIALWKDRIFAVTGNGVGGSHQPPLTDAPSFIAVDKTTGKLLWQDDSPGQNVMHGQWGVTDDRRHPRQIAGRLSRRRWLVVQL